MSRPLLSDGPNRIRDFKSTELYNTWLRIAELYYNSPSVDLNWVSSGGNITPNMTDTRYKSGTAATKGGDGVWGLSNNDYPSESETGEPILVTGITYDRISQTLNAPATFNQTMYNSLNLKPVYRDTNSSVREMTLAQLYPLYIDPIVTAMVGSGSNGLSAGSYFVDISSSLGNTNNEGIVFADTTANTGAYSASNIGTAGTTQDIFNTKNYYLHKIQPTSVSFRTPLIVDGTSGLRHMTYAEFDSFFGSLIQHAIYREPGYTLRYNINGAGTTQGTTMSNKVQSGVTGNFQRYQVANTKDYRAQEFPNGTLITQATWQLKLHRT